MNLMSYRTALVRITVPFKQDDEFLFGNKKYRFRDASLYNTIDAGNINVFLKISACDDDNTSHQFDSIVLNEDSYFSDIYFLLDDTDKWSRITKA